MIPSDRFAKLDSVLQEATPRVAPAVVCRVEQGGEPIFRRAYGWLDPDQRRHPTRPGTVFDLASLTKLFTATAFLRLVDAGVLALDQAVADVVPGFGGRRPIGGSEDPLSKEPIDVDPHWSTAAYAEVDAGRITFRQLLTHTGGLPAWRSVYRNCGPIPQPGSRRSRRQLRQRQQRGLAAIVGYPFIYPPGEGYAYSDIGLILLGIAVTRARGDDCVDRGIRDLVTRPLGMMARFNPPPSLLPRIAPTEFGAWRQRRLRGEVHDENAAGLGGVAGHAGLFATAWDVCRLGQLYLNGGQGLLSEGTVAESLREQVCTPNGIRRGLGWMLRSKSEPSCSTAFSRHSFGHTGFTGTSLWCDPERALVVALLTNRVYHGRDAAGITVLRPAVHAAIARAC